MLCADAGSGLVDCAASWPLLLLLALLLLCDAALLSSCEKRWLGSSFKAGSAQPIQQDHERTTAATVVWVAVRLLRFW